MSATSDVDGSFGGFEMLGKDFYQSIISFAVVRFGAKIDGKLARGGFDDFFLTATGFDGDGVFHIAHYSTNALFRTHSRPLDPDYSPQKGISRYLVV